MHPPTISSQKYSRFEKMLLNLGSPRTDLEEISCHYEGNFHSISKHQLYSSHFSKHVIDVLTSLVLGAHGGIYRKREGGGLYVEEHIAEIMEIAHRMGVPPSVIFAYGVHDFDEDNRMRIIHAADKETHRETNRRLLEQQVLDLCPRRSVGETHISRTDRNIILNVSGLMTKPLEEELVSGLMTKPLEDELGEFEEDMEDRRFVGKVFGALGGNYWDRKVSKEIRVNEGQRHYARLGILLDMFSNGNPLEMPKSDSTKDDKRSFEENQVRNTLRLINFGKLLDYSIRQQPESYHTIMNKEQYERFRREDLIPRIQAGIDKFNLDVSDSQRKYWNL